MSRITAPIAKLVRTPASSPAGMATRAPAAATLLDSSSHSAGASLMPKYAELLQNRRSHEHSDVSASPCTASDHPASQSKDSVRTFSYTTFSSNTTYHHPVPPFSSSDTYVHTELQGLQANVPCLPDPPQPHDNSPSNSATIPGQPPTSPDANLPLRLPRLFRPANLHTHRRHCLSLNGPPLRQHPFLYQ